MAGRVVLGVGVFVAFGGVGLAMAASARRGWQSGDTVDRFHVAQQWWAVFLALAVALVAPILIIAG